jgi:hypothetical protein
VITVDGESVRADWGRMIAFDSSKKRMIAAVDLRSYYMNRETGDMSQNYFRVKPTPEPWFDLPRWQMPNWFVGNRPNKMGAPAPDARAPAITAYRVVSLVRTSKPYALIFDEMNMDDLSHDYRWQMVLPPDLCGQVTIDGSDAIITDPETGNFVLVRPVISNDKFTTKYEETEMANGVIVFETKSTSWKFAVLLMAFEKGEIPPSTKKIPELISTLKKMKGVLVPDKTRIVNELKDKQDSIKMQLDGFTLDSLGETLPIEILDSSIVRVKGIVGQAYEFNGDESLVVSAGLPPFDDKTPFTVSFWAKSIKGVPRGTLYANNANRGLSIAVFQGKSMKVSADGNWYWARPPQKLSDWCHLVFTYDGKKMTLYQNGAVVKEADCVGCMEVRPGGTTIGEDFKGWIDDLRVYPQALTKEQIAKLHKYQRYVQGQ